MAAGQDVSLKESKELLGVRVPRDYKQNMPRLPTDELPEGTDGREDAAAKDELSETNGTAKRSYYYDDAFGYRDYDPGEDEEPEDPEEDPSSPE